jgi:Tfp pilus assembly protein PilN
MQKIKTLWQKIRIELLMFVMTALLYGFYLTFVAVKYELPYQINNSNRNIDLYQKDIIQYKDDQHEVNKGLNGRDDMQMSSINEMKLDIKEIKTILQDHFRIKDEKLTSNK